MKLLVLAAGVGFAYLPSSGIGHDPNDLATGARLSRFGTAIDSTSVEVFGPNLLTNGSVGASTDEGISIAGTFVGNPD